MSSTANLDFLRQGEKLTLKRAAKPPKNVPNFKAFGLRNTDFTCSSHGFFDVIFNLINNNVT